MANSMNARKTRQTRGRYKIWQTTDRPYVLSVKKTNQYMYLQLDRAADRTTVLSVSSKKMTADKLTVETAQKFGEFFVKQLKEIDAFKQELPKVVYDRSGYAYHGKVKALAEGARAGGLEF